jgi:hypothetical protein
MKKTQDTMFFDTLKIYHIYMCSSNEPVAKLDTKMLGPMIDVVGLKH